ncbi:flagellar motor switch protein FliN [Candidatus Uabimicrobium amorphum]|uniref:Flagellar motor switch protein FliN n=1 Tax=Uabimicrobium amorphum TaxID=2596890 RepID=A0A5S9F3S1_UABAM|nr:flagellar motor switch protein FliN [Candidatus Uabimicrobium amorphum]BBM85027.1 flagellar motor switch protein FliN [Candidatus Uabimicrobium amorphum]
MTTPNDETSDAKSTTENPASPLKHPAPATQKTVQENVEVSPINAPNIEIQDNDANNHLGIDFVKNIPVTVTAELGHIYMNIEDVLVLAPGSLIHLQRELDEPIDLLVNDKLIAKGEIVTIENRFGVRITKIINSEG